MITSTVDVVIEIINRAGIATGIPHSRIYSATKQTRIVRTRWAIMRTLRIRHCWTLTEIGEHFGMDHSNIAHGLNRAAELVGKDKWFAALCKALAA
jgi:chromosomal replication initiation ATPase DnaA